MPLVPWTLGLHPTQLYEAVSMILLFLVLMSYYPLRRHDGQVIAVMMVGYGIHRYLNELLRADERPVGFESCTSVFLFAAGIALWVWLARLPAQYHRLPASAKASAAAESGRPGVPPAVAATATSAAPPGPRRSDR